MNSFIRLKGQTDRWWMHENACTVYKSSDNFWSYKALTTPAMNQYDIFLGFGGFFCLLSTLIWKQL